ncbi:MAG TPA: DUF456 domain-containing protein [Gemmatimonadales bacterium]
MLILALSLLFLAGLFLIALGLPGIWVMALAVIGYAWLTGFHAVGVGIMVTALVLAGVGEALEAWLGFGLARRYGGSRRAGWGALLGGLVGAGVGVPVPLIGSVIGGLVGSFAGAMLFEYSNALHAGTALRAGWGALLGRVAATTAKMGLGIIIAVVTLFAALRG